MPQPRTYILLENDTKVEIVRVIDQYYPPRYRTACKIVRRKGDGWVDVTSEDGTILVHAPIKALIRALKAVEVWK